MVFIDDFDENALTMFPEPTEKERICRASKTCIMPGCSHREPHNHYGACDTPCNNDLGTAGATCVSSSSMLPGHEGWGTPVSGCKCSNCSRLNIERAVKEYYDRKTERGGASG